MRILVDSDACPVKDIIWKEAQARNIPVIWVVSTAHHTQFPMPSTVIQVDSSPEAVDMALFNQLQAGDLVVTQDYGLASLAIEKKCQALSCRGVLYRAEDMDRLLTERYMSAKIRRAGGRTRGPSPMRDEDRSRFELSLNRILAASDLHSDERGSDRP